MPQARLRARRGTSSPSAARRFDFDSSLVRQSVVWLLAAKIFGLIVLFDPGGFQAFDLPKSLFSRATESALGAALLVALIRYGWAIVPRTRIHFLLFAVVGMHVVSAVLAEDRYVALYGERERYLGLTFVGDMVVMYLAASIALRRPADWIKLAAAASLATAISVLYAFAQRAGLDPVRWADTGRSRPFATFGNPDMFGHFLAVVIGLSVAAFVFASGRHALLTRVIACGLAACCAVAASLAATRSVVLAVAAMIVLLPALYLVHSGRSRATVVRVVAGLALAAAVVAAVLTVTPLGGRVLGTFSGTAVTRDRILIYETAMAMLRDRPIFGHGVDNFGVVYPLYRSPDAAQVLANTPQSSAHSWLLQTAVTTGLLGLASVLALIAGSAWVLLTEGMRRSPLIAGPLLVGLAAYWATGLVAVGSVGVDWFPWLAFGATAALVGRREETVRARERHRAPVFIVVALGAIGVLSGFFAFRANHEESQARSAWRAGRAAAGVAAAQAATRDDGGRADHWNWLGLALEQQKQDAPARDAFAAAAARSPHNAVYRMNEALAAGRLALASGGDGQEALQLAWRAVHEDPNQPSLYVSLADIEQAFAKPDDAIQHILHALVLYPGGAGWDAKLARASAHAVDLGAARAALAEAARRNDTAVVRVGLSRLALKLGDLADARANAKRALELEPSNADAQALLQQLGG